MELKSEKITIRDLLQLRKHNMLIVNHEYQRAAVWSESQQKKLIDSVMRGYPLPLIYLHHRINNIAGMQSEGLEIIDGQQRINALYEFGESALKLFDPIRDDKKAKFPNFIKASICPWAGLNFLGLPDNLKARFLDTEMSIVKVTTDIEDEARDLFIRLQAGLPLNAQEKRDAWPGGFTELVLKLGGKNEITRYPGHDFFRRVVKKDATDRGAVRQLCAQISMLFFEKATQGNWIDIGTQQVDDYYYQNLGFDVGSQRVERFSKVLDLAVQLFNGQNFPRLQGYEAIHVILLLDSLLDEYTKSWQAQFMAQYDYFKQQTALAKKERHGEYWFEYGSLTQTQSAQARTIQRRHAFFVKKMVSGLDLKLLDQTRIFGAIEREIVYYRDSKKCAVCDGEISWRDLEIHHVEEHQNGGITSIENAVSVHKDHHPKGQKALEFYAQWLANRELIKNVKVDSSVFPHAADSLSPNLENSSKSGLSKSNSRGTSLPPDKTRCKFIYDSQEHDGIIKNGFIEIDNMSEKFSSFSAASQAVSKTSRNGWLDWQILLLGSQNWLSADDWRRLSTSED